ncbi:MULTISPECIES: LysE family transporter [Halomonadaceae]|uniref:Transporter n=1 Tax=Vreelandella piezotolerans TaxID=2609667 RepID=A0ABQ6XCA8_9GAMM|nr:MULTISPECIES: LysE family transporter [Halomonas]KAE8439647.1 transporter [Halomonas piezotolerans]MCG7577794.1 LysE family transporter [Halomonas sp. MMH1-48]MCG7591885.1 LysE family transporter [Halomonas sp. McD50-5]MCG7604818.1 LysE family transporter [Halomonas sp. MM17-34]MCG7614035.1 LysE family transporter [Halomonas sp. MM17-29]
MLAIVAYALGVMYTPGPVNLLGLNVGINGQGKTSLGFCLGVGLAMLLYLLVLGWAGAAWISQDSLVLLSALGCAYILYLAYKVARANATLDTHAPAPRMLSFRDGLMMQLLNPKAMVATLPIATLQFPAEGIQGMSLFIWALGLAALAAGAPGSYVVIGSLLGQRVRQPMFIKGFNWIMAGLLVAVSLSIGYEHVWLVVTAQN